MITTFGIFCATVLFFRADSIHDAFMIWNRIFADIVSPSAYAGLMDHLLADKVMRATCLLVVAFFAIEWIQRRHAHPLVFAEAPTSLRWAVYSTCIWASLFFMPTETTNPFIYFVF
jgi:hypothetical protein